MLWLFLLAAVTGLVISRRRVLRRQAPLSDQLYSSKVALEHVHSGASWIRSDGRVGSLNQSLADTLVIRPEELLGQDWTTMFPAEERDYVQEAYASMLLAGIASLDTWLECQDGRRRPVNLRLVAVHDSKMRLAGHHCVVHDESRERSLEQQVRDLAEALKQVSNQPIEV